MGEYYDGAATQESYGRHGKGLQNQISKDLPSTQSPVLGALTQNATELSELHQAVMILEKRLSPVLGGAPPQEGTGAGVRSEPRTVVDHLETQNAQIRYIYAQLRGIIDRLHV